MSDSFSRATFKRNEEVRFKGFIKMPRVMIQFWSKQKISSSAFCLYMYLASSAYFDKKNSMYQICPFTTKELAELTGKTIKTIQNWLRELKENNMIKYTEDGFVELVNYESLFKTLSPTAMNESENISNVLEELFIAEENEIPF